MLERTTNPQVQIRDSARRFGLMKRGRKADEQERRADTERRGRLFISSVREFVHAAVAVFFLFPEKRRRGRCDSISSVSRYCT